MPLVLLLQPTSRGRRLASTIAGIQYKNDDAPTITEGCELLSVHLPGCSESIKRVCRSNGFMVMLSGAALATVPLATVSPSAVPSAVPRIFVLFL